MTTGPLPVVAGQQFLVKQNYLCLLVQRLPGKQFSQGSGYTMSGTYSS